MASHAPETDTANQGLVRLILELAAQNPAEDRERSGRAQRLEQGFLDKCPDGEKAFAMDLLDLARASYRLRDDDNIYLGRIEAQVERALDEGRNRLGQRGQSASEDVPLKEVTRALRDPAHIPTTRTESVHATSVGNLKARQLVGQPAGQGIAVGPARVIEQPTDLFEFQSGDILVCDAVDPNMTFVVPLAAAIIERRGGMLIHGAIIAREYGLPCVTGIPDATRFITTGDRLTVDGYLGIVTLAS